MNHLKVHFTCSRKLRAPLLLNSSGMLLHIHAALCIHFMLINSPLSLAWSRVQPRVMQTTKSQTEVRIDTLSYIEHRAAALWEQNSLLML